MNQDESEQRTLVAFITLCGMLCSYAVALVVAFVSKLAGGTP